MQNKHIILIKRQDVINPGRFSMKCPFCGCDDTQVKDSRNAEDNTAIRRRRECPECGSRFTTFERIQLRDLIVVKKNGEKVMFDRDKLEHSILLAVRKRPVDIERVEKNRQFDSAAAGEFRRNGNSFGAHRRICDGSAVKARSYRLYPVCVGI